jgi:aspartyl-tRNA(Asn)/glutamyl-tRNA(Gln) amidotransferase subunit B
MLNVGQKIEWETVIGLEVHVQLSTQSKLFSGAPTAYGAEPNTQACEVDLALPGVLPVLNQAAVEMAIKFGLSIAAEIPKQTVFARKNYFYPDLPKGYQISQLHGPIVGKGHLLIQTEKGQQKKIGITRAHLEEDAGKSLHETFHGMSGIDLNRAGVPLLEVVSEPDLRSAKEAVAYLKVLHTLVRYLEICDGNMQEGSFRCDANVSIRPKGEVKLGTRAELKNINSFRFVERAIEYEIERQKKVLEAGGEVIQETRLYDSVKNETRSMRTKEEAQDYRYFPDPDLLPLSINAEMLEQVRLTLPELPWEKQSRFIEDYQLSEYDAEVLTMHLDKAQYFEKVVKQSKASAKMVANWVMGDLFGALNKAQLNLDQSPIQAEQLAQLLNRIADETLSGKMAKEVFERLWNQEGEVDEIIEKHGFKQVKDTVALEKMIDQVLAENPEQVEAFKSGKDKLFAFFVGQVMKLSKGKMNPKDVSETLKKKL